MAKTCDFKTSEASTKAWMRKRNLLTKFLEIPESKLTHFRQQNSYWSKKAFQRHHQAGIKPGDMLFYEEPGAKKVIPNTEMFRRIDADKGNFYQENLKYANDIKTTSNLNTDVKAGVLKLFESNPEIASIGTPEQYSQYLNTIFPGSKVKDIVYHGSDKVLSNVRSLSKEERNFRDQFQIEDGIFFSKEREGSSYSANEYGDVITPAIVNVQNPELSTYYNTKLGKKLKNSDSLLGTQIGLKPEDTIEDSLKRFNESYETTDFNSWSNIVVVFKPEQVHILGSKQDIKGFKKFADSTSKQLSDKFVDDLYNLNLTPEVITYLYNENGSTSKLEDYAFILRDLVNNLKSQGFTNLQILEDIKCL